jgi:hypothetical protein
MTASLACRISLLSFLATAMVSAASSKGQDAATASPPIAFSEFAGYRAWQLIAPALVPGSGCGFSNDGCLKVILGNATMIEALRDGIPANGKPVPDGAAMAKLEWTRASNPASPYDVVVPGVYQGVSFMVKDSKRFPRTDGWGYALFRYNADTGAFEAVIGARAAASRCHTCHLRVKALDYVFTNFARR